MIRKEATSKLRLLSRAGTDLAGVGGRALKWFSKRGIRSGFSPEKSRELMSAGMLPSANTVVNGTNRGTINMLTRTPLSNGVYTVKSPNISYLEDSQALGSYSSPATVRIPDIRPNNSELPNLMTRLNRADIARHEARERVRAAHLSAANRRQIAYRATVAAGHQPGVLYDNRVHWNSLSNRLGVNIPWDQHAIGHVLGIPIYRNGIERAIGNAPLSYSYKMLREANLQHSRDINELKKLLRIIRNGKKNGVQVDRPTGHIASMFEGSGNLRQKPVMPAPKFQIAYRKLQIKHVKPVASPKLSAKLFTPAHYSVNDNELKSLSDYFRKKGIRATPNKIKNVLENGDVLNPTGELADLIRRGNTTAIDRARNIPIQLYKFLKVQQKKLHQAAPFIPDATSFGTIAQ